MAKPHFKDPGITALIAFVAGVFGFCGVGHVYVGKIGKGILIMLFEWFLLFMGVIAILGGFLVGPMFMLGILLLIGAVAVWFWQIFDAYNLAKEYNEAISREGEAPW